MTSRLLLIALATLLSVSERSNAGVMLYVDFGTNSSMVNDLSGLTTTYSPNGSKSLTANIYLHLTGGSSLYGYQFTVRYNASILDPNLNSDAELAAFQTLQDGARLIFRDPPPYRIAQFSQPEAASDVFDQRTIGNFMEIRRFNGYSDSDFTGSGFYKIATINFSVVQNAVFSDGTQLVRPGIYFTPPDVNISDAFYSFDSIVSGKKIEFSTSGGSVSSSSTVPEPTSALVLGVLVFALQIRRVAKRVS